MIGYVRSEILLLGEQYYDVLIGIIFPKIWFVSVRSPSRDALPGTTLLDPSVLEEMISGNLDTTGRQQQPSLLKEVSALFGRRRRSIGRSSRSVS